jgi:hypothetical protein
MKIVREHYLRNDIWCGLRHQHAPANLALAAPVAAAVCMHPPRRSYSGGAFRTGARVAH